MTFAFIGGGGGSGIIILIGLVFLAAISAASLAGSIAFAFQRRPRLAVSGLLLALAFGFFPCKMYLDYSRWAEYQKTRKRDFDVTVNLSPAGEYVVAVDGTPNPSELILLQGEVTFQISFPDLKTLKGRCTEFQSRRIDGGFGSLELGRIDIDAADRSAFLADFVPPPAGARYDAQTEDLTIWFRRVTPDFEWFTVARRTN